MPANSNISIISRSVSTTIFSLIMDHTISCVYAYVVMFYFKLNMDITLLRVKGFFDISF